jgi:hypothetical protein
LYTSFNDEFNSFVPFSEQTNSEIVLFRVDFVTELMESATRWPMAPSLPSAGARSFEKLLREFLPSRDFAPAKSKVAEMCRGCYADACFRRCIRARASSNALQPVAEVKHFAVRLAVEILTARTVA